MPCDSLPLETSPHPKPTQLKKLQSSDIESDEGSEDEVDFHYVSPQVLQSDYVVEPENI